MHLHLHGAVSFAVNRFAKTFLHASIYGVTGTRKNGLLELYSLREKTLGYKPNGFCV